MVCPRGRAASGPHCLSLRGSGADIHSVLLAKDFVPNLKKHALVPDSNVVVPVPIKTVRIRSLEIPRPRKGQVDEALQE